MKHLFLLRAAFTIAMAAGFPAHAALENRVESLGPLKRYDPNAQAPEFLTKIHGDPRLGLPAGVGEQVQRLSDQIWYVETERRITRMTPNYPTGQVMTNEVIEAGTEWSVSPDGRLLFACRLSEQSAFIGECFDLATGEPKWAFEKRMGIIDVRFTPDGSQVVILHNLPGTPAVIPPPTDNDPESLEKYHERLRESTPSRPAAVSWYDAESGELVRRVDLPGNGSGTEGAVSDHLAFSGDRLYVTRPCDKSPNECLVIKAGAETAEKIDVGPVAEEKQACVWTGGVRNEFVVFHNGYHAVLFRQETDGALTRLNELKLETSPSGRDYKWTARFTPDGKKLVLSSCIRTIHLPTAGPAGERRVEYTGGSHLADFSENGAFFVTFDNGGGRVRNSSSWETMVAFETKLRPPHCCPVTEAGFSITGNYIISSDESRLLLWSKEGEQIAELSSPASDDGLEVRMQSPVIVEEKAKVYAADGHHFLMWDLKGIRGRVSRKPDNIPRVKGQIVFKEDGRNNKEPMVMNIRIDPKGENIITATCCVVRYRPLDNSDPVNVRVPGDINMNPRTFMTGTTPFSVFVRAASGFYSLDLTGRKDSEKLGSDIIAADSTGDRLFGIPFGANPRMIWTLPAGNRAGGAAKGTLLATLPGNWELQATGALLSSDERWIVAIPTIRGKGSVIAVMAVSSQKPFQSISVPWTATSLSLSEDGKSLLVGSSNRAVYSFDFQKMTAKP
ncbi:hypothetical protein JIN84_14830 [Luteolibacter yonseiensis]|uniref:WD40 repeat protein n=1 Tax=Luteolibacter yonseiensis TaxID=1144680 RepID=A0A934R6J5_9BACT|nr:hypothetical protein [Luteolibacter yonseiensis]MBK1816898.1 hypothetical protein [Luteolibacter yonseiensis]